MRLTAQPALRLLLAGCAVALPSPLLAADAPPVTPAWFAAATASAPRCEGAGRAVHARFERGALASCSIDAQGRITAIIRPEVQPINPSPWYAMVITGPADQETQLTLSYDGGRHRYAPWAATPGTPAALLDPARLSLAQDRTSATLTLPAAPVQLVIAQPPETIDTVLAPFEARVRAGQLVREDAGYTHTRRPIPVYHHRPERPRGTLILITRQHPPETTGPTAFAQVTDALLADTPQARALRRSHALVIVPLANPDGFALGHWRGNLTGADLNRDWGPFVQPETQALARVFEAAHARAPVLAVIDFHSTMKDVIYAPPLPDAPDLNQSMLAAIMPALEAAQVRIDRAHNPGNGVLKSWAKDRFNTGAITWEVGDASPAARTNALATAAAQALMDAALTPEP